MMALTVYSMHFASYVSLWRKRPTSSPAQPPIFQASRFPHRGLALIDDLGHGVVLKLKEDYLQRDKCSKMV